MYFEMMAKALSYLAALRQQALIWSLKVKRSFIMTHKATTEFFRFEDGISIQVQINIISHDRQNSINWNLLWFAFSSFHFFSTQ